MTKSKKTIRRDLNRMNQKLGAEFKAKRLALGMSQAEMARILGSDQTAVSRIENGTQVLAAVQWLTLMALKIE